MWRSDDWETRLDTIDPGLMGYEKSRELVDAGADLMAAAFVDYLKSLSFYVDWGGDSACGLRDKLVKTLEGG